MKKHTVKASPVMKEIIIEVVHPLLGTLKKQVIEIEANLFDDSVDITTYHKGKKSVEQLKNNIIDKQQFKLF
jgi:hypothetical protein